MRILIIANARTGSTTIAQWIASSLKYECIYEPLNNKMPVRYNGGDNVVVKELYNHFKDETQLNEFIKLFDKVIGLTRTDELEVRISMHYGHTQENFLWEKPYELSDDWIEKNKEEILFKLGEVTEIQNKIKNIPNTLQITYEGIFTNRNDISIVKDYVGITTTKFDNLLNNKLRYRNRKRSLI